MKKAFRSILVGALALLTVSCYDDLALREEISALDERVTAIEETLSAEVGGINDLLSRIESLEGKIAAVKLETKDGVTTLTLSDNSSVVLSKNGVLTIVDGGWATVAADGTVTALGIPVSHDHKLAFKVEGGELKVSYDGKTYEATGVKVSEYTAHVIGNVVPAADGKSVAVTIGDQTLQLPLVSSAVATLGLSRDNFFLYHGGVKTVAITADNLADVYVMNEPAGWKANIEEDNLVITAPKEKHVKEGLADEKGLVLVHATTDEGKCIVAKIEVSTGLGLAIECDKDGKLTISNAYTGLTTDRLTGEQKYGFSNYFVGIVDTEVYGDGSEFAEMLAQGWADGAYAYMYNLSHVFEFRPYEEVVYEVDQIQTTVAELYNVLTYGDELAYGSNKTIWVVPVDGEGMPIPAELQAVSYTHVLCQFEVSDITHKSATLTCKLEGATRFYAGVVDGSYPFPLETIMSEGDLWMYLQQPEYLDYWYGVQLPAGEYTGETAISLVDLNMGEQLSFGSKYYVYVFPYMEGTVYNDFNAQFAPYVVEINTLDLLPGGAATVTFGEAELGYESVLVPVTLSEGTESVYYSFYTVEEWAELEDKGDKAIFDSLVENCWSPLTYDGEASYDYAESGQTLILAAVAVGTDGKYGEIVSESYTTLSLPSVKNEALTVTFGEPVIDFSSISVEVTPVEGAKVIWYFMSDASLSNYSTDEAMIEFMVSRSNVIEETGIAKQSYLAQGSKQNLVMLVLDAENNYNIVKKDFTTLSYPYSETMTIECASAVATGNSGEYTLTFNVAGASQIAVWSNYTSYRSSFESYVITYGQSGTLANGMKIVDVVDGKATVVLSGLGNYRCLYATAISVAEGGITGLSKTPCEIPTAQLPVVTE